MQKSRLIVLLLCTCFLVSCSSGQDIRLEDGKPHWYWRPNSDGKPGGVGISGMHIKGLNAQRTLAVQRAIDDIARQLGVQVKSFSKTTTVGNQDSVRTGLESYSIQMVDGTTVKATIRELWEDPATNELYVWMVVK